VFRRDQERIPAMNRTTLCVFALGCLLVIGSSNVRAELISFDDLRAGLPAPAGYGGLSWSNKLAYVANSLDYGAAPVSPPNALFSPEGFVRVTQAGPGAFTFVGAAFAGVGEDLSIAATGSRNGTAVYTTSFTVRGGTFSFETLNFQNIDALAFLAAPLNVPSGVPNNRPPFLIDNFRIGPETAPEPGSLLLFGIGTAASGLAALRRRLKPSPD
jgi:hypothetical protein